MSIIRIKRSGTSGNPATLAQGELAYSYLAGDLSNGGDRLYIGTGTEINGDAVNHEVIGGKYFTDMMDHTLGTLTANSAILVDGSKKINELLVDNLHLDSSSIKAVTTDLALFSNTGEIYLATQAGGSDVVVKGLATPTADDHAVNKQYADGLANQFVVTFGVDGGYTDTYQPSVGYITYAGGTGITTTLDSGSNTITYTLDNTAVTPGSYGSQTQIPTFTVDAQGRLTDAGVVNVATNLTVNNDPISLLDSDLNFAVTEDITLTYDSSTNTATFGIPLATTSSTGTASFFGTDFDVSTGEVSLADDFARSIVTDSGTATPFAHSLNLVGDDTQGIQVHANSQNISLVMYDADVNQKGVASFETNDFDVTDGHVELKDTVVMSVAADSGTATPSGHLININGGQAIDITAASNIITVNAHRADSNNVGVASFNSSDFDLTNGHVSIGSIGNDQLDNTTIKIGDTTITLGDSATAFEGLTKIVVDDITLDGNVISTPAGNPTLYLDPAGDDSSNGTLIVRGDLQVTGTQTIINSNTVSVNDLNIVLADSAADLTSCDGAGLTIGGDQVAGTKPTLTYDAATDRWDVNVGFEVPSDIGGEDTIYFNGTKITEAIEDHLANNFFTVGEGLDITYGGSEDSDNIITFSAEIATKDNLGVASFDSDQFTVTTGAVTVSELDGGTY